MSQTSSKQAERVVEFNKIIPELKIFLRDILENEDLTEASKNDCIKFLDRLDGILKPPSLPPRSGRVSTTAQPTDPQAFVSGASTSTDTYVNKEEAQCSSSLVSPEYLERQRELSRKATLWKAEEKPLPPLKPTLSQVKTQGESTTCEEDGSLPIQTTIEIAESDSIYQRIFSVDDADKHGGKNNGLAPPVPERTSRNNLKIKTYDGVKIMDLPNALYSGLLRNVGSNTKQWCVIKHQKLFLFNDLDEQADFVADLNKYEVIKDPSDMYVFHVTQQNTPSIKLAAVDEDQYELWYDAFKRAKLMTPPPILEVEDTEKPYLSLPGASDSDQADGTEVYEKPEDIFSRSRSPEEMYVAMGMVSPRPLSPPTYETMDSIRKELEIDYRSMDLPPTPGDGIQEDDKAPPLPARTRPGATNVVSVSKTPEAVDSDSGEESLNTSCESLEIHSDTELDKSREKEIKGQSIHYTLDKNTLKGMKPSEVTFLRDLSAAYCGILHQRRMLAVWQKRYCKVKDQSLLCYRTPDDSEPVLNLNLSDGFQLDRAEEAWQRFAFKIFKDNNEVYYFAAINNAEQMRWLNALAKAIDKEKFDSSLRMNNGRKSQNGGQEIDFVISSEDSFDSNESSDTMNNDERRESDDGDVDSDDESKLKPLRPFKHLHPAKKARRKNRPRAESMEDPDAEMQGYLYKKLKNHWAKRWCAIKDKKFYTYKHTPKERPEEAILLTYAALSTPEDTEHSANYYMFKLRFEGDSSFIYRSRNEEQMNRWIQCLQKYVGSTSEEPFPYINVPPTPREKSVSGPEYSTIDGDPSLTSNNSSLSLSASPTTPSSALTNGNTTTLALPQRRPQAPSWSETEIEESYISGKLTELQICHNAFRHIERFVIITKEKWLKVYTAINSTSPILVFNALDIEVKEENGVDGSVLHLLLGSVQVELLLKASHKQECDQWKDIFEKIHYEDIDDDLSVSSLSRARSRSIENDIPRLGQGSASRTMPNLGKRKKIAREQKTKTLQHQQTAVDSPTIPRRRGRAISSLIRSFTIDTLGRKVKNKSYELPKTPLKEEDIVLKETQHGIIKQVLEKNGNEIYEERFCRIRGKIFQCFTQETENKPLFKIPLKNAAIEDFANPGTALYRFTITALDTGADYTFALNNERELDAWTAALFGDDQLHKSLENSPIVPRKVSSSTFFTPTSPVSLRESIGSKDSVTEEDDDISTGSRPRSITVPVFTSADNVDGYLSTERICEENISKIATEVDGQPSPTDEPVMENVETPDGSLNKSELSLSSTVTSRSTLSESEYQQRSPTKLKLKAVTEEPAKACSLMFETSNSDFSKTISKRWVVLRKTVLELYKNEWEKNPIRILNLGDVEVTDEGELDKLAINLKLDDQGGKLTLITPDESTRGLFVTHIKKSSRSIKRQKNPRNSVTSQLMRRLGSGDRLKELKSKKDNRLSMLLVEDDVQAIEKYEDSADLSKMMSGVLMEYTDDPKSTKEKERYCWIQNGVFHVAKIDKTKPIKSVDLSTVVVLDESDPLNGKHAFKLEYTHSNGKRAHVYMRAMDSILADKWMVALSMGILYHRLTGSSQKETEAVDSLDQDCFGFGSAASERDVNKDRPKVSSKDTSLRKEISEKLAKEDADSLKIVRGMLSDQPDGEERPEFALTVEKPRLETRLSNLNDEEDQVFNETVADSSFEILENIPEKENADEAFRNVKGILRQQESIRRTILKNQREKRVPPPIKPKPSKLVQRKPTISSETVVNKYGVLSDLTLPNLHSYAEQLESERAELANCIKRFSTMLSGAIVQVERDSSSDKTITEAEHVTLSADLKQLQDRAVLVEKELKECRVQITRKVASKGRRVISPEMTVHPPSGRSTPTLKSENKEVDMDEVQMREDPGRQDVDTEKMDSIII